MLNVVSGLLGTPVPPVTSSYESIATANGTGSSAVITFSSIPSTYKHLQIRYIGISASQNDVMMKLDTNTGLKQHALTGDGSSATAAGFNTGASGMYISDFGFTSTYPTPGIIDLLDYSNTNKYKTARILSGRDTNGAGRVFLYSGLFDTTSAISSITFTGGANFSTTCQFALYGIKG